MKLVLLSDPQNPVFFEHRDVFSAEYEILVKVENRIKTKPPIITMEDYNDMVENTQYHGGTSFYVNGVFLVYRDFIDLREAPRKNPVIRAKIKRYVANVIEVRIMTLDNWFDSNREGYPWSNLIHSTLKNSVDTNLDKL